MPNVTTVPMHRRLCCWRAQTEALSMSKQWNLKSAVEIHMINTHFEAGERGGSGKIPAPRPIISQLCQRWPPGQTEEARIVTDRAGIVYC